MKHLRNVTKLFLAFTLIAFISCSDDNAEETPQQPLSEVVMKDFQENFNRMSVPSSLQNSSNPYAQQASTQFTAVKSLGQTFSSLFTVPAGAVSSSLNNNSFGRNAQNTTTYTWSDGNTTVTYKITDGSDRYSFEYTINLNGNPMKFMDGYQLKDNSYAEAKLYSDNVVVSTLKWWLNGDVAKVEIDASGQRLVLESNTSNNSGNIKVYDSSTLIAEYEWNSDGTGWYKNYITNETFTW